MDCSPQDSSVRGIFQVGILEWVAISFSINKHGDYCVEEICTEDYTHGELNLSLFLGRTVCYVTQLRIPYRRFSWEDRLTHLDS